MNLPDPIFRFNKIKGPCGGGGEKFIVGTHHLGKKVGSESVRLLKFAQRSTRLRFAQNRAPIRVVTETPCDPHPQ